MESTNNDPIKMLFDWVAKEGGVQNAYVGEDPITGVRGIYATRDFNKSDQEEDVPIIQIPNHLLITAYHISNKHFDLKKDHKYNEIFKLAPELFDPKYPYKQHEEILTKKVNDFGEYFQLAFYLITEKLKGTNSDFHPFINYLPKDIGTLYTYPNDTKISPNSNKTLIGEIELEDDGILDKIAHDRKLHQEQKERFMKFITTYQDKLDEFYGSKLTITEQDFDWAWMNVGTRCFGTHHIPGDIGMVPLLDLMNHNNEDRLKYYIQPFEIHRKMITRSIDVLTNKQLDLDYYYERYCNEIQDPALEFESQDLDQHRDDYPNKYYNYLPQPLSKKDDQNQDNESESDEEILLKLVPIETIWKLDNKISFGIKPNNKHTQFEKGQEITLCYGERANSFLLVEYGFTIKDSKYDFVRLKNISINTIINLVNLAIDDLYLDKIHQNLKAIKMKSVIQADLKLSNLNRDLLRLIRCVLDNPKSEIDVLNIYRSICQQRLLKYSTSLQEDLDLLEKVQSQQNNYHWIYQYILIYRIGQKQILQRQLTFCDILIEAFETSNRNWDLFKEKTDKLRGWNGLIDYINDVKEIYF